MIFDDRRHAGRLLGERLRDFALESPVVLGLPRGGVPVAEEVARALHAPLDVIIVRKLGVPFQPELGMGALGEDGVRVLNHDVIQLAHVSESELQLVETRERRAIDERVARYRACRRPVDLQGRNVVIVDDGIATGGTARAAVQVARARGATSVMVAVPVAAPSSVDELLQVADGVVAYETPGDMMAIGRWYRDFGQTTDDEVMKILLAAEHAVTGGSIDVDPAPVDTEVEIPVVSGTLGGHLTIPARCHGIVIFAHGSGSSRHSPRNRSVARFLNLAGIGTLLFDLLDDREATNRRNVFDIELLAHRLSLATQWLAG
jgi:putative phosphoribosyl transferase